MAELDFDAHLTRLYAEPPAFPDTDLFTALVSSKLDRGWAIRRMVIGAAGVVAGLIAAGQIVATRFAVDVQTVSNEGVRSLNLAFDGVLDKINQVLAMPSSTQTLWLAAALGAIALAFAVTRAVEEF